MGTHAVVAIEVDNKVYRAIYVHYDGDLAGSALYKYHNSYEGALALVNGGDVVSVMETLDKCEPYGSKPRTGLSLYDVLISIRAQTEYIYVWKGGQWMFGRYAGQALASILHIDAAGEKRMVP